MIDDDFDSSILDCSPPISPLVPTHIPFIDVLLGGGQKQDGVYGLLGPIGSCKTTTGIMLAVEGARRLEAIAGKAGRSIVMMVSYEQKAFELQTRALSCVTGIASSQFTNQDRNTVLRRHGIKPDQIAFLNRLVFVSHVDGDLNTKQRLEEGMSGIADLVSDLCDERDAHVGLVIVDYLGAIATITDMSLKETSQLVASAGNRARLHIARRNDCPVWLVHQVSGQANNRAAHGLRIRSSQADGSAGFSRSLDATLVFGKPNLSNLFTVECAIRERKTTQCRHRFASLKGDICRIEDAGEEFVTQSDAKLDADFDDPATNVKGQQFDDDDIFL